jgi:hypothetical protein
VATSKYFRPDVKSEQNLIEDLIIETLKIYGQDVYYLPRDIVDKDPIFADDVPSRFNSSYRIEMYIENPDGYDGDGDIFSKFGVELRDSVVMIVSRRRWRQTIKRYDNEITGERPREGDLIYINLSNSLFEITHVEHELPFYQINNVPTFKLRCEKFEYTDEQLATGVKKIDDIEGTGYNQILQLVDSDVNSYVLGGMLTQTLPSGPIVTGEIVYVNDSDNVVRVAHVGSNTDDFHMFVDGVNVVGVDENGGVVIRTVSSLDEQLNSRAAQNEEFGNIDFIDFTENNPFGDPEVL